MRLKDFGNLDARCVRSYLEIDIRKGDRGDRILNMSRFMPDGQSEGLYDYEQILSVDCRDLCLGVNKTVVEMPCQPVSLLVSFVEGETVASAINVELLNNNTLVATFESDIYAGKEALFLYHLGEYTGSAQVDALPSTFILIGKSIVSGETATLTTEVGTVGYVAVIIFK